MERVVVYGTLKRGGKLHHYLRNSKHLGKTVIDGYKMYNVGSFPCIVKADNSQIFGEIYEVSDKTLSILDYVEGTSSGLYTREQLDGGAFIYVWGGKVPVTYKEIPSGEWEVLCV